MARLTGTTVAEVQADRLGAASRYAQLTSSVVVLKGACTVVAAPDGTARLSDAANAMLAHAGTGDVLAGLIGGLIAQGLAPADAAGVAVYLHADAGRRVAEAYGTAAGLAQDLLRALPESRKLFEAASAGPAAGGPFGVGMPDLGGLGGMAGGMQSSGGLGGQDLDALLGSGPPRGF
jgi:NAD(P)H-hydrate epimerase